MNRTEFIGLNLYYSEDFVEDMKNNYNQEIERLKEWKEDLLNQNINLEDIRKKAIEYIKENICDIDFMKKVDKKHFMDYDIETTFKDIENLLNILGGDKNE